MAHRTPYAAFALLTVPARARPELWRLGLGVLLAVGVMFGLARGILALVRMSLPPERYLAMLDSIDAADTPYGLLMLLGLMGVMGIGAMVSAEVVHARPARSLFGPGKRFWQQFWRVCFALLALNCVVMALPPWSLGWDTVPGVPPGLWLSLLPLTLVALLIQTGAEEVLFRGYLQSQLAARLPHPLVWICVPSALFAFAHHAPDVYGSNAPWVTLWAFLFGLAAADLTARAGTLAPAIALHLVNNFLAIAVLSLNGDMSGLALSKMPFGPEDEAALARLLPLDLAMMAVSWLAARLALRV